MIDLEHRLMDVRKDGKIFQRTIDCIEVTGPHIGAYRAIPTLLDGEELVWVLGDEVPTIVQGQLRSRVLDATNNIFNRPFPFDKEFS
jgi:hypothetical protein